MELEELVNDERSNPITDDDRISHTSKMVQRVFGVEAAQLGTVEVIDGKGVLVINRNGQQRRLRWARAPRAHVQWFLDDDPAPLRLSSARTPLIGLIAELDS